MTRSMLVALGCLLGCSLAPSYAVKFYPEPNSREAHDLHRQGMDAHRAHERKKKRTLQKHANGPVRLSPENFTEVVLNRGKNAFVMFCKSEDSCHRHFAFWELGTKHKNSHKVTVAIVECFKEDWSSLCDEHDGPHGDVHIKYWTPETGPEGELYKDGRGLHLMDMQIREKFSDVCSARRTDLCGEKEKAYLAKQKGRPKKELQDELERLHRLDPDTFSDDAAMWLSARVNILESLVPRKVKEEPPKKNLTPEEAKERIAEIRKKAEDHKAEMELERKQEEAARKKRKESEHLEL